MYQPRPAAGVGRPRPTAGINSSTNNSIGGSAASASAQRRGFAAAGNLVRGVPSGSSTSASTGSALAAPPGPSGGPSTKPKTLDALLGSIKLRDTPSIRSVPVSAAEGPPGALQQQGGASIGVVATGLLAGLGAGSSPVSAAAKVVAASAADLSAAKSASPAAAPTRRRNLSHQQQQELLQRQQHQKPTLWGLKRVGPAAGGAAAAPSPPAGQTGAATKGEVHAKPQADPPPVSGGALSAGLACTSAGSFPDKTPAKDLETAAPEATQQEEEQETAVEMPAAIAGVVYTLQQLLAIHLQQRERDAAEVRAPPQGDPGGSLDPAEPLSNPQQSQLREDHRRLQECKSMLCLAWVVGALVGSCDRGSRVILAFSTRSAAHTLALPLRGTRSAVGGGEQEGALQQQQQRLPLGRRVFGDASDVHEGPHQAGAPQQQGPPPHHSQGGDASRRLWGRGALVRGPTEADTPASSSSARSLDWPLRFPRGETAAPLAVDVAEKTTIRPPRSTPSWASGAGEPHGELEGRQQHRFKGDSDAQQQPAPEVQRGGHKECFDIDFASVSAPPLSSAPQEGRQQRDVEDSESGLLGEPSRIGQQELGSGTVDSLLSLSQGSLNINSSIWYYRDPSGTQRGPFSGKDMHSWWQRNYFSDHLLMRWGPNMPWIPFGLIYPAGGPPPFTTLPDIQAVQQRLLQQQQQTQRERLMQQRQHQLQQRRRQPSEGSATAPAAAPPSFRLWEVSCSVPSVGLKAAPSGAHYGTFRCFCDVCCSSRIRWVGVKALEALLALTVMGEPLDLAILWRQRGPLR
ncbi:hypothetical protein cyc_00083 [Cyclospora cayetanensis]|uniref:GYF domain-containing protein n=1 Tax=Cyclospora cayetanensis TaxID=88456 RepID=A0A1D3D468_9EIME|nr:hypothetical protein cyc_00083 [Cyclospora cayetanensis]